MRFALPQPLNASGGRADMLLGVIADDFTGASDIGNTLAKGGLATAQFLGVPQVDAPPEIAAGVIALKSRSIPAPDAVAQSLAALGWLRAQGCQQIIFKYCSTFDSTLEGNIGPVGEALADALGVTGVIACPAFPTVGRTVYRGHLFVHDRLLNESGLENHPINPMTDADLRRWLARQTRGPVGLANADIVRSGPDALRMALENASETLVIVDSVSDDDLLTIGKAVADAPLLTGGSGIALGLPRNFFDAGLAMPTPVSAPRINGPEVILAGSCSGATRDQIEHHAVNHPVLPIDVNAVMDGSFTANDITAWTLARTGQAPLVYSSGSPEQVRALQDRHGRERVSETLDTIFGEAAKRLVNGGIRRIVVAGGETSGAVVSALDTGALTLGAEIDPGVPALVSAGRDPIALALKSGNFGAPDFFAKALNVLGGSQDG